MSYGQKRARDDGSSDVFESKAKRAKTEDESELPPVDDTSVAAEDMYSDVGSFMAMIEQHDHAPRRSASFVLRSLQVVMAGDAGAGDGSAAAAAPAAAPGFSAAALWHSATNKVAGLIHAVTAFRSAVPQPPPILIWLDKSRSAFASNASAIHQIEDDGWRVSLHDRAEDAEAVFLGHMQHVKCIIVNLHFVDLAYKLQALNPHLVAVVWSLYASQNQDVADQCRRKGALVATNRKHLLQLVSQSHPKHHAAAAAAAAASAGAASSVESKGDAKEDGKAGSAADGGDSKASQTAETIFWIDSDGESIAKNKGIADEFEKSGWVVRAFASLADAERAFHPFVKVVIASLAAQKLVFSLKARNPSLTAIIWSRTASTRADIAAKCREQGAEVPTTRDELLRLVANLQARLQREALVLGLHSRIGASSSVYQALGWTNKAFQTAILGRVFRFCFEETSAPFQRELKRSNSTGMDLGDDEDDEEGDLEWTPGKKRRQSGGRAAAGGGGGSSGSGGSGGGPMAGEDVDEAGLPTALGSGAGGKDAAASSSSSSGKEGKNGGGSAGKQQGSGGGKESKNASSTARDDDGSGSGSGSGSDSDSGDASDDESGDDGDDDEVGDDEVAGLLNDQDADVAVLAAAGGSSSSSAGASGSAGSGSGSGSGSSGGSGGGVPGVAPGFSLGDYVVEPAGDGSGSSSGSESDSEGSGEGDDDDD